MLFLKILRNIKKEDSEEDPGGSSTETAETTMDVSDVPVDVGVEEVEEVHETGCPNCPLLRQKITKLKKSELAETI